MNIININIIYSEETLRIKRSEAHIGEEWDMSIPAPSGSLPGGPARAVPCE